MFDVRPEIRALVTYIHEHPEEIKLEGSWMNVPKASLKVWTTSGRSFVNITLYGNDKYETEKEVIKCSWTERRLLWQAYQAACKSSATRTKLISHVSKLLDVQVPNE